MENEETFCIGSPSSVIFHRGLPVKRAFEDSQTFHLPCKIERVELGDRGESDLHECPSGSPLPGPVRRGQSIRLGCHT
jgi:hypothetical protein